MRHVPRVDKIHVRGAIDASFEAESDGVRADLWIEGLRPLQGWEAEGRHPPAQPAPHARPSSAAAARRAPPPPLPTAASHVWACGAAGTRKGEAAPRDANHISTPAHLVLPSPPTAHSCSRATQAAPPPSPPPTFTHVVAHVSGNPEHPRTPQCGHARARYEPPRHGIGWPLNPKNRTEHSDSALPARPQSAVRYGTGTVR
jgi:hypothetical protein